jgi:hypothetical protein
VDGYQFEPIGMIQGSGNSDELKEYLFFHDGAMKGMNYFQLHSTDVDGHVIFAREVDKKLSFAETGLFFIHNIKSGKTIRLLIP